MTTDHPIEIWNLLILVSCRNMRLGLLQVFRYLRISCMWKKLKYHCALLLKLATRLNEQTMKFEGLYDVAILKSPVLVKEARNWRNHADLQQKLNGPCCH